MNLNTSHVKVNHFTENYKMGNVILFKYISC